MGKTITRDDINEVRGLGVSLEKVVGYKGVSVLRDVISNAVSKEIPIICVGGHSTGKSTALKVVISEVPNNDVNLAVDEINSDSEIRLIRDGKVRYCTMYSTDIESTYRMIAKAYENNAVATLLIELVTKKKGRRTVNSVYEIVPKDNGKDTELLNIVDVHKEKFRLVNELI